MAAPELDKNDYSWNEFLTLLAESKEKLEYLHGQVYAMAGATLNHNRIKEDTAGFIYGRLDKCRPFSSDQAVANADQTAYFFPDLVYVCEEKDETIDDAGIVLLNPSVIIEVLSKSTVGYDRGKKFHAYWQIPSLQAYVLIDSNSINVDLYQRHGDAEWTMRSFYRLDQIVTIPTLEVEIPMQQIYKRVSL